jgi:hypothetical protein
MKSKKKNFILTYGTILVSIFTLVMLSIGCSTDHNIMGASSSENSAKEATYISSGDGPDFVLPEGLELVALPSETSSGTNGSLDGLTRGPIRPIPMSDSEPVDAELGGTVTCQFVGCDIPAGALPYDAVVTATLPNPAQAIVDFGPHPLTFNEPVQIWFNLASLNANSSSDNLAMWYVAEDGTLVPVPLTIDHNLAIGYTNHFSRYILTRPGS